MAKVIAFKVVVNGIEKVITNGKELKQVLKDIRKELDSTEFGTPAYDRLRRAESELLNVNQRLKVEAKETRQELKAQSVTVQNLDGDYEDLSAQLSVLTTQWRKMGREARQSLEGQNLSAQIRSVKDEIRNINRAGTEKTSFLGNIKEQFSFFLRGGLVFEGIQRLINGIEQLAGAIVDVNSETSDLLAEIQRVAGLSRTEVRALFDELESLDTRTPTSELLNFAAIGGRLGIVKEELAGFAEALDKINIAFAGTLGNDAEDLAETLGKINNIFDVPGGTVGEQLSRIGNALIELDNAGVASPQFVVDFTNRLAGLEEIAGLSLSSVAGMAAAFDELGQSPEVASTAVNSIILQIGKDLPNAAQLAGIEVDTLRKLFEEDAVEALLAFSNGIVNNADNLEEFSKASQEFGLDGRRAVQILGALGGNTEIYADATERLGETTNETAVAQGLFERRIRLANEALQGTDAITTAVSLKQETLAGRIARLQNAFSDLINSPAVQDFLGSVVSGITSAINAINNFFNPLQKLKNELSDQTERVNTLNESLPKLLSRYDELSEKSELTKDEQAELKEIIAEIGKLTPAAATEVDRYGNALSIAADKSRELADAERERLNQTKRDTIGNVQENIDRIQREITERTTAIQSGRRVISQRTGQTAPLTNEETTRFQDEIRVLREELSIAQSEMTDLTGAFFDVQDEGTEAISSINLQFDIANAKVPELNRRLKELRDALKVETDEGTKEKILNQISAIEAEVKRRLAAIPPASEFAAGSLGRLREEIQRLEGQLENTSSVEGYVKVYQRLQEVIAELTKKQRDFDNAILESNGGSIIPERLPTAADDERNVVTTLQREIFSLETIAEIPDEQRERALEVIGALAEDANQLWLDERKKRFEEEVEIERELAAEQLAILGDALQSLGELTGQAIEGELDGFKDFLRGIFLIFIDSLENLLTAQITARGVAALAAGDVTAPARAVVAVGAVRGLFAVAKSAINVATAEEGIVYSGDDRNGFTGHGSSKKSAGYIEVHKGELVHVWPQRVLHHPEGQRIIREAEGLRKSLGYHTSTPRMGFQEGGIASLTGASPVQQLITVKAAVSIDDNSIERIESAVLKGSEGGSMKGMAAASETARRKQELSKRTGF